MKIEIHVRKVFEKDTMIVVTDKVGFSHVDTTKDTIQIVFADKTSADAIIYKNNSGEIICSPIDLKKLLGT